MFAENLRVTSARERGYREGIPAADFAGFPRRHKILQSRCLLVATAVFIAVAAGAVFRSVMAYSGFFDACVATLIVIVGLGGVAVRTERRRPVAFETGQDGLTTWDRAGHSQYRQISGCAQWSDRLIALILISAEGRSEPLLIPADALTHSDAFRELAVRARRCAQEHL